MSELRIYIKVDWCHPEFGGQRTTIREYYSLSHAERQFDEISKDDCAYKHTSIFLAHHKEPVNETNT